MFGNSGVVVSVVLLGMMIFGNQIDLVDVQMQMDMVLEVGIIFLDIVEMYFVNFVCCEIVGCSEEFIGEWFFNWGNCDWVEIVIKVIGFSDKVCCEGFDGVIISDMIDVLLKWLWIDCIDVYQLYWLVCGSYVFCQNWCYDFLKQDWEKMLDYMVDVLGVLVKVQQVGKICVFCLFNESVWGIVCWCNVVDWIGVLCVVIIQNEYLLMVWFYDLDLVEMVVNEDVILLVYFCFVVGFLIGKYVDGMLFEGSCVVVDLVIGGFGDLGGWCIKCVFEVVVVYYVLVVKLGLDLIYMVIVFIWQWFFKCILIIGVINCDQLKYLIEGIDLVLIDDVLCQIEYVYKDYLLFF